MKKFHSISQYMTSGSLQRKLAYQFYLTKYFNLFMGAYKFKGITPMQQDYILRKFWSEGSVAAFIVKGTAIEKDEVPTTFNQYPNGVIAFCPFAPFMFDIYDWAIQVNLVQSRGATFIPTTPQIVNKDVVIGYAQRSKKSVLSIVDFYLDKIVDVEMTIRVQLKSHKVPWLVTTSTENEDKLKKLFERVENDEEVLYVSAEEVDAIKSLVGGNAYIIDKLFQYKQGLENELLTILGIDNLGILEKKEHLVTDEVNSNNDLINDNSDNFLVSLQEFCERIKTYLGYEISVEATSSPISANKSDPKDKDEGEDDYEE